MSCVTDLLSLEPGEKEGTHYSEPLTSVICDRYSKKSQEHKAVWKSSKVNSLNSGIQRVVGLKTQGSHLLCQGLISVTEC